MGLNFDYYDGLQPEMRAGIINEHESTYYVLGTCPPKVASTGPASDIPKQQIERGIRRQPKVLCFVM